MRYWFDSKEPYTIVVHIKPEGSYDSFVHYLYEEFDYDRKGFSIPAKSWAYDKARDIIKNGFQQEVKGSKVTVFWPVHSIVKIEVYPSD